MPAFTSSFAIYISIFRVDLWHFYRRGMGVRIRNKRWFIENGHHSSMTRDNRTSLYLIYRRTSVIHSTAVSPYHF